MPQIINEPTFGGNIGASMGAGLSQGLQQLAQMKMQDIQQAKMAKGIRAIDPSITPEVSRAYASSGLPITDIFKLHTQQQQKIEAQKRLETQKLLGGEYAPTIEGTRETASPGIEETGRGMKALQDLYPDRAVSQPREEQVSPKPPITPRRTVSTGYVPGKARDEALASGYDKVTAAKMETEALRSSETEKKIAIADQKRIDTSQSIFLKSVDKSAELANEAKSLSQEALRLIETGKTAEKYGGYLTPTVMRNPETRELDAIYAALAAAIAGQGGGQMSKMRIQLAKDQKPSINQPKETQINLLNRMISEADSKGLRLKQIVSGLIEANQFRIPEGLGTKAIKEFDKKPPSTTKTTTKTTAKNKKGDVGVDESGEAFEFDGQNWKPLVA